MMLIPLKIFVSPAKTVQHQIKLTKQFYFNVHMGYTTKSKLFFNNNKSDCSSQIPCSDLCSKWDFRNKVEVRYECFQSFQAVLNIH